MNSQLASTMTKVESIADQAEAALKELYVQYPRLEASVLHEPNVFSHRKENKGLKRKIVTLETTIDSLERQLKKKTMANDNLIKSINSLALELSTVTDKLNDYRDVFDDDDLSPVELLVPYSPSSPLSPGYN